MIINNQNKVSRFTGALKGIGIQKKSINEESPVNNEVFIKNQNSRDEMPQIPKQWTLMSYMPTSKVAMTEIDPFPECYMSPEPSPEMMKDMTEYHFTPEKSEDTPVGNYASLINKDGKEVNSSVTEEKHHLPDWMRKNLSEKEIKLHTYVRAFKDALDASDEKKAIDAAGNKNGEFIDVLSLAEEVQKTVKDPEVKKAASNVQTALEESIQCHTSENEPGFKGLTIELPTSSGSGGLYGDLAFAGDLASFLKSKSEEYARKDQTIQLTDHPGGWSGFNSSVTEGVPGTKEKKPGIGCTFDADGVRELYDSGKEIYNWPYNKGEIEGGPGWDFESSVQKPVSTLPKGINGFSDDWNIAG